MLCIQFSVDFIDVRFSIGWHIKLVFIHIKIGNLFVECEAVSMCLISFSFAGSSNLHLLYNYHCGE